MLFCISSVASESNEMSGLGSTFTDGIVSNFSLSALLLRSLDFDSSESTKSSNSSSLSSNGTGQDGFGRAALYWVRFARPDAVYKASGVFHETAVSFLYC